MNRFKKIKVLILGKQLVVQALLAFSIVAVIHTTCASMNLLKLTIQPFLISLTVWGTGAYLGRHLHKRVLTDEMFVSFFTSMTGSYITAAVIHLENFNCSFYTACFSILGGLIGFYLPIISHRLKLF